jgi:hypothetical protein
MGVMMLPEERFDRFMHWVIILERVRFERDLCIGDDPLQRET